MKNSILTRGFRESINSKIVGHGNREVTKTLRNTVRTSKLCLPFIRKKHKSHSSEIFIDTFCYFKTFRFLLYILGYK